MHAFISQAGGGMCWWRTPQNYRLTRYRFYNMPIDSPGFYVYIRMQDGTVWSPAFRPCEIAEGLLGRGDIAWKYYRQLIPNRVIQRIGLDAYRGEAYAYSCTMLGPDNEQFGQACVSQVTGTAAWMDVAVTQYLLGVRPTVKGLIIDPAIPGDWKGYTVSRRYRGCELNIRVSNPDGVQQDVKKITVNG